jgi:hypothetical protein
VQQQAAEKSGGGHIGLKGERNPSNAGDHCDVNLSPVGYSMARQRKVLSGRSSQHMPSMFQARMADSFTSRLCMPLL